MLESTPTLAAYSQLFTKHLQNAIGDVNVADKVRNFKYLKMIYETFNNHDSFAKTEKTGMKDFESENDVLENDDDDDEDSVEDDKEYEEGTTFDNH